MGDIKRQKKKYSTPRHPWQKDRILAEKELITKYGLRRKYEIWKMNSILKNFSDQAKKLTSEKTRQVEIETGQLLKKLSGLGLLEKNAKIADVLSITLNDIMGRRLQTLVFKKSLAKSVLQARQFIVHRHVTIGDKTITTPSYLVPLHEESLIQFTSSSSLSSPSHAERLPEEKKAKKKEAEGGKARKKTKEKTAEK